MRAGRRERRQQRGCPGGPLAREHQVARRGVELHGAELAVELGGGPGGEVGVEAGSAEAGSAEARSAEAGRLVVHSDEGYGRGGCVVDQQSLSVAECSRRRRY